MRALLSFTARVAASAGAGAVLLVLEVALYLVVAGAGGRLGVTAVTVLTILALGWSALVVAGMLGLAWVTVPGNAAGRALALFVVAALGIGMAFVALALIEFVNVCETGNGVLLARDSHGRGC